MVFESAFGTGAYLETRFILCEEVGANIGVDVGEDGRDDVCCFSYPHFPFTFYLPLPLPLPFLRRRGLVLNFLLPQDLELLWRIWIS